MTPEDYLAYKKIVLEDRLRDYEDEVQKYLDFLREMANKYTSQATQVEKEKLWASAAIDVLP